MLSPLTTLRSLAHAVADYTLGTAIVVVHLGLSARRDAARARRPRRLSA
ncbi:MAG: hypothetical protein KBG28_31920 [Kofleriaceae bacterium]|jgi:hypothetical protein|nr:hypothetical protein [Kofleriaceae bacterium]MBP6836995.1 hypothetical protein [Kofleriaceae bacterium]MBP9208618.1 hypothetical protein [Kofleriaceae bacterium]